MRRGLAILLVLSSLVTGAVPAARGQAEADYTSPTYGFTVRWDTAIWQDLPADELVADGPHALDRLRLESPMSSLYVEASRRYAGSATRCSAEELGLFTLSPQVSDVEIRTDLASSAPDRSIEVAEGTLTIESGESIRLAVYVDCRALSPEATLLATVITPAEVFDQALPPAQELIEAIEMPGAVDPALAFAHALGQAEALDPASGPLDGSLALEAGALHTVAAGVDLADFAASSTFANPYAATDHPFDIGFGFRHVGGDDYLKLVIDSDGIWYLKEGLGPVLTSGRVDGLRTGAGETNTVELIARGGTGGFAVNGTFVADLDLTPRTSSGEVFAGSGFFAEDALAGRMTGVEGFTVWPLANADGPLEIDEETFEDELAQARQETPLAGPASGTLIQVEGAAALAQASVMVNNFAARVRWANPDSAFWDVGVAFRDQPDGRHFRLTFDQTGSWAFGVGLEPKLASGGAPSMQLGPGAVNTLEILVVGGQAAFSINGVFVSLLDVSVIDAPGDVWFGSGFSAANVAAGTEVRYRDFAVWPLPTAPSSPVGSPEVPTVTPLPTVEPTPTIEVLPTVESLPTVEPSPTPVPLPTPAPIPSPPLLPTVPSVATTTEPTAEETAAMPSTPESGIVIIRLDEWDGSGVDGFATVTEVQGRASLNVVLTVADEGDIPVLLAGSCGGGVGDAVQRLTPIDGYGRSRTLFDAPTMEVFDDKLALAVVAPGGDALDLKACGEVVVQP